MKTPRTKKEKMDELHSKTIELFNNLPFDVRLIASNAETITRIGDLQRTKKRIKENYERELTYINAKITAYKRSIIAFDTDR